MSDQIHDSLVKPPFSVEAEQAVLGACIISPEGFYRISDEVSERDFFRTDHKLIYRAIEACLEKGSIADIVTLSDYLNSTGDLEKAGGMAYLGALAKDTPTTANMVAYARIVREKALLRELISALQQSLDDAYNSGRRAAGEIVDEAQSRIIALTDKRATGEPTIIKASLSRVVDDIDERFNSGNTITGIKTGFDKFDEMTNGLQRSDLIVVGGRPSHGKTSFTMNIAEHVAITEKIPVLVFSMEMSTDQLSQRSIAGLGRIPLRAVQTGRIEESDWSRITTALSLLSNAEIYVDESPGIRPAQLRTKARKMKKQHDIGLIVVDYLQLMESTSQENRTNQVGEFSRVLKKIAKELDVPVIAISQLNRSLESRPKGQRRPAMSDIRESGAVEQDADVIVFVYRDEVYDEDSPDKGTAEIIIGKQRNGPTGVCRLTFLGQYTKFENYCPDTGQAYTGNPYADYATGD